MKKQNRYTIPFSPFIASGLLVLLFLLSPGLLAADQPVIDDPDGMFFRARELAFDEQYEEALELCNQILDEYPEYTDVRILKARILGWQAEFVEANNILREVLQAEPSNEEALFALIDIQMWYGDYEEAIKFLDIALADRPNDPHLLYRKAFALKETGDELAAVVLLNQILDIEPTYTDAKDLLDSIESGRLLNHVGVGYRGHYFLESNDEDIEPWHLFYAEMGRRTRTLGPVIARVNHARRHDMSSFQFEIDAYPTVREGTYFYLNAGYSHDRDLFPITRFGFELFQALPASWEVSGGFRIMNFDGFESNQITKDLLVITGSLSKYYKAYYFSFRPYFTFSSDASDAHSQSYFLTMRRYFTSTDHHLSLIVGRGFSADFDNIVGGEIYDLSGTLIEGLLQYQQKLSTRFLIKAGVGYKLYDEDADTPAPWGSPLFVEGGLMYRF